MSPAIRKRRSWVHLKEQELGPSEGEGVGSGVYKVTEGVFSVFYTYLISL